MSVTHGYGPTCWKKVQHTVELELAERNENKDNVYMNAD
jgi:plasmid maintenance system antidote protein VapI